MTYMSGVKKDPDLAIDHLTVKSEPFYSHLLLTPQSYRAEIASITHNAVILTIRRTVADGVNT